MFVRKLDNLSVSPLPGRLTDKLCSPVSPTMLFASGPSHHKNSIVLRVENCTFSSCTCSTHEKTKKIAKTNRALIHLQNQMTKHSARFLVLSLIFHLSKPPKSIFRPWYDMLNCNSQMWEARARQLSPLIFNKISCWRIVRQTEYVRSGSIEIAGLANDSDTPIYIRKSIVYPYIFAWVNLLPSLYINQGAWGRYWLCPNRPLWSRSNINVVKEAKCSEVGYIGKPDSVWLFDWVQDL